MHSSDTKIDPQVEAVLVALCEPHIAVVTGAPYRAFTNGLKIMHDLSFHELVAVGAVETQAEYLLYCADPVRWINKATDRKAAAWWEAVQARQPAWLKAERGIGGTGAVEQARAA